MKQHLIYDLRALFTIMIFFFSVNVVLAYFLSVFFRYKLLTSYTGLLFIESSILLMLGGGILLPRKPPSSPTGENEGDEEEDKDEKRKSKVSVGINLLIIGGGLLASGMLMSVFFNL